MYDSVLSDLLGVKTPETQRRDESASTDIGGQLSQGLRRPIRCEFDGQPLFEHFRTKPIWPASRPRRMGTSTGTR